MLANSALPAHRSATSSAIAGSFDTRRSPPADPPRPRRRSRGSPARRIARPADRRAGTAAGADCAPSPAEPEKSVISAADIGFHASTSYLASRTRPGRRAAPASAGCRPARHSVGRAAGRAVHRRDGTGGRARRRSVQRLGKPGEHRPGRADRDPARAGCSSRPTWWPGSRLLAAQPGRPPPQAGRRPTSAGFNASRRTRKNSASCPRSMIQGFQPPQTSTRDCRSQVQLTLPEHGDRPQPGPHGHEQDRARHGRQQRHRQGDRAAARGRPGSPCWRIPDLTRGEVAAKELVAEGYEAVAVQLEVTDDSSVRAAAGWIEEKYGRLDVLVNNAAVIPDGDDAVSRGAGRRLAGRRSRRM